MNVKTSKVRLSTGRGEKLHGKSMEKSMDNRKSSDIQKWEQEVRVRESIYLLEMGKITDPLAA